MTELLRHLFGGSLHASLVVFASHEDVKRLVCSRDNALSILLVALRILELLLLGIRVCRIGVVDLATHVLRWRRTIVHPCATSDEILYGCSRKLRHLRNYLYARRAVADDRDALVRVVVIVVPSRGVRDVTFEAFEAGDLGPVLVSAKIVSTNLPWRWRSTYTRTPCPEINTWHHSSLLS